MNPRELTSQRSFVPCVIVLALCATATAQDKAKPSDKAGAAESPYHEVVNMLTRSREAVSRLPGYSCTLIFRQRQSGKLSDYTFMSLTVIHEPLTILASVEWPREDRGTRYRYDSATRDLHVTPAEPSLKNRNRYYPGRIIHVWQYHIMVGLEEACQSVVRTKQGKQSCDVNVINDVKVDDRATSCVEVTFKNQHDHPEYRVGRIYIDKETSVAIRFESYDWSANAIQDSTLIEECTFRNVTVLPQKKGAGAVVQPESTMDVKTNKSLQSEKGWMNKVPSTEFGKSSQTK